MNIKHDWPIIILIAMLGIGGTLLALYSPKASAEGYVALTKTQPALHFEGRLDSVFDQWTQCMSCDQVTGVESTSPYGIRLGWRSDGDWYQDMSINLNQQATIEGQVQGAYSIVSADTYGVTLMGGRRLPYGFSLAAGMSYAVIDAKVDAWTLCNDYHYDVKDSSVSPAMRLGWSRGSLEVGVSKTFGVGTRDRTGSNDWLTFDFGVRF